MTIDAEVERLQAELEGLVRRAAIDRELSK
jgi:hypothetical protein